MKGGADTRVMVDARLANAAGQMEAKPIDGLGIRAPLNQPQLGLAGVMSVGRVTKVCKAKDVLRFDGETVIEASIGPSGVVGKVAAQDLNARETDAAGSRGTMPRTRDARQVRKLTVNGPFTIVRREAGVLESEKAEVLGSVNTLVHVVVMAMAVINEGKNRGGRVEGSGKHEAAVKAVAEATRAIAATHATTMSRLNGATTNAK